MRASSAEGLNDMTKFVFVTGGVVSSLGKGIASASLAAILESRGLKVTLIKLDPYLNVDPGTMSPFQHGEVFVTDDGAETDLDLGHYERFITTRMKRSEQLHHRPDLQERAREGAPRRLPRQDGAGDPARHQRDPGLHPARRRRRHADEVDVAIVEIGGTVGDIESLPFLEAVRQMSLKHGPEQLRLRAPDLRAVDRRRRRAEDQADAAHGAEAARDRHPARRAAVPRRPPIPDDERAKISLFTNVPTAGVISVWDVDTIYKVPRMLHEQGLDELICDEAAAAHAAGRPAALGRPGPRGRASAAARSRSRWCGKYVDLSDSYKSLNEALRHAGIHNHARVKIEYVDSETLDADERRPARPRSTPSWCPAASASAASKARSCAAQYARENKHALPRHLPRHAGRDDRVRAPRGRASTDANSTEFDPDTPHPVIALITSGRTATARSRRATPTPTSAARCAWARRAPTSKPGTLAHEIYGDVVTERHRHRYEANEHYLDRLQRGRAW